MKNAILKRRDAADMLASNEIHYPAPQRRGGIVSEIEAPLAIDALQQKLELDFLDPLRLADR
jgi:hypothetical protein